MHRAEIRNRHTGAQYDAGCLKISQFTLQHEINEKLMEKEMSRLVLEMQRN